MSAGVIAAHYVDSAGGAGGGGYKATVLADAPWGFWEQLETSGTSLADSSGNSRPLAITGTPTLNQTGPGSAKAISWPAGTHYGVASPAFNSGVFTMEAMVYLTALPSGNTHVLSTATGAMSGSGSRVLWVDTSGRPAGMVYTSGSLGQILTGATPLSLNQWHHLVFSVGPGGAKLRVNKATVATAANTASYTGQNEWLFLHSGPSNSSFPMNPGPLRTGVPAIYAAQLSDARTDAHYDAMSAAG